MKRCPTCNRFETDVQLKFCRVDGTGLLEDSGVAEFSATRILPTSSTGEAEAVHTDHGKQATTTVLETAKQPQLKTGEAIARSDSLVRRLKRYQAAAIVIT